MHAANLRGVFISFYRNGNAAGLSHLHAVVKAAMQGGLFSCSLPLDAIINGRERRAGEPIRSLLACQPKTNCLLALTAGFYLHNSNPKAKAICTWPTPTGGAVFTNGHMREEDGERWARVGGS